MRNRGSNLPAAGDDTDPRRRVGALARMLPVQITFWTLHWNRGTPVWEDQGEHIDQTVWEQIDNGVPWTRTRKMFMIVPIVL